jgi:Cu2+-containing amine oxidase
MHDVAIESRPVMAPSHPLDPLTPDEIRKAANIVRAAHDLGRGMLFETITLREPDKAVVRDLRPGAALPREAFVCAFDRTNGRVYEAHVDLSADALVDWRHVPGVRPRILFDDIKLVGEVARIRVSGRRWLNVASPRSRGSRSIPGRPATTACRTRPDAGCRIRSAGIEASRTTTAMRIPSKGSAP